MYYYHIDFWSTFVLMIAVAICLIFSGIKIATTLFEIMFSQLITPFIIATDLNGSGRAKKAIQNMLLSKYCSYDSCHSHKDIYFRYMGRKIF